MSYEYLAASLPMFFFGDPPPMTTEELRARCAEQMTPRDLAVLDRLLEGRAEAGASGFEGAWAARERQIRAAAAAMRAPRYGADPRAERRPHPGWDGTVEKGVADAFSKPTPLEREMALDRERWRVLDELAPAGVFTAATVWAYALKLRIAERWAALREEDGRKRFDEQLIAVVSSGPEPPTADSPSHFSQVS
jgi:hypothetical protein